MTRFLRLAVAVCQLAVLCSSTVALAASASPGALSVGAGDACSCDHSTGVMCPMHRKGSTRPAPANGPRWCKGADGATYALLPVLGTLAMPERVVRFDRSLSEGATPAFRADTPRLLDQPPDSPPPRA